MTAFVAHLKAKREAGEENTLADIERLSPSWFLLTAEQESTVKTVTKACVDKLKGSQVIKRAAAGSSASASAQKKSKPNKEVTKDEARSAVLKFF